MMMNNDNLSNTIIIVDNNAAQIDIAKKLLQKDNYQLVVVDSSAQLLNNLTQNRINYPILIIIDINLADSLSLLQQLKLKPISCDIPIIIKADRELDNNIITAIIEAGAVDYIELTRPKKLIQARVELALCRQKSHRQAKELWVINEMNRAFIATPDRSLVLDTILEQIKIAVPVDACSVFLIDEDSQELVLEASLDSDKLPKKLRRLALGQGIVGWVIEHVQPELIPDARKDSRHKPKLAEAIGLSVRSIICVPIIGVNKVIGAVQAINEKPYIFTDSDLRLLMITANHAAVALDNIQLHNETLQRLSEISALQTVGAALISTIELDDLLETIVSSAILLQNVDCGSLILFKGNNRTEVDLLTITLEQPPHREVTTINPDGVTDSILKNGKVMVVTEIDTIGYFDDFMKEGNWGGFIGLPLKIAKRMCGVLYLSTIAPKQIANLKFSILDAFVSQATLAIEHAILYQETSENLKRFSILYKIAQTSRNLRNSNHMLKFIATTTLRYFRAEQVMFFELDEADCFKPLYLPNISDKTVSDYIENPWYITEDEFLPLNKGSIQVHNLQKKRYNKLRERLIYKQAKSWYAIPLQIETKTTGIMVLVGQRRSMINEEELQLVYTIAGHTAVNLENIRLIKELETQTAALRNVNQKLFQANKIKSHFLANVSHELRTPLNSIIGYGEILCDEIDGPLTADQADSVERILRNGRNLLKLIDNILDLTQVKTGNLEIYLDYFSLYEIIDTTITVVANMAERKKLSIVVGKIDPSLMVYADRVRVGQTVLSLLSNAIKFTSSGHVEIQVKEDNNRVAISVSDTGTGIAKENLPYLFDEFYQADNSPTREYDGTGLGLALVKRLLTLMDGEIVVKSELGKGSRFTVILPGCKAIS